MVCAPLPPSPDVLEWVVHVASSETISAMRIWNYNKGPQAAARGVKLAEIRRRGVTLWRGTVHKAAGRVPPTNPGQPGAVCEGCTLASLAPPPPANTRRNAYAREPPPPRGDRPRIAADPMDVACASELRPAAASAHEAKASAPMDVVGSDTWQAVEWPPRGAAPVDPLDSLLYVDGPLHECSPPPSPPAGSYGLSSGAVSAAPSASFAASPTSLSGSTDSSPRDTCPQVVAKPARDNSVRVTRSQ